MNHPIQVLLVDDNSDFANLTAQFLEREHDNLTVTPVTDVQTARDKLFGHDAEMTFDCVVSDYDMPTQTGIEFLKTVRPEYPDLPFILFTGKGSEEVASEAISAGVTDYLQKQSGTEQYTLLANRIANAVETYRSQQALTTQTRELKRYERMVNSMHEAACIYDADGRFTIVNEYLADWYDTTPEALIGTESNLIPHIRDQSADDPYQALLDGQRAEIRGELEAEFPGHGFAVLEYRLTPLEVDGEIDGVVGVARDITARKKQREELQRKNRAMDEAPIGITISDPDQDDNPLIYANERFQELTGYDKSEVIGRNCRFLQGDRTDSEAIAAMRSAIENEESVTVELRNYRNDGSMFWNRVTIAPVTDDTGTVQNYVGFQESVTERKEQEQALQRRNEQLEAFTGIVSHDLRNPLNVAEGRVEAARAEVDDAGGHLEKAASALDRMESLIDELLTLARSGERVSDVESVRLDDVVASCWENVSTGDATIVTEDEARLRADETRLKQLLENLIRNAIEHGGNDVTVTIGELVDGFYVADDGPGIDPADRAEVFEPGVSMTDEGTGFGLTIVKEIVEAHDWELEVTESSDGGACFEIRGVDIGS